MPAKAFGSREQRKKAAIILDTDRYQKFISDIAGQDVHAHGGKWSAAIHCVRDFLACQCGDGVSLPGGTKVVERYGEFREGLPSACRKAHFDPENLTFRDLTTLIVSWLETHPLSAS